MKPHDLVHRQVELSSPARGEGARVIDFLPWAFPPAHSIPIDVVDVRTVNAGLTATILIATTEFSKAVLRFFGNEASVLAGYADMRWSILLNGTAYQPYITMRESRGLISNPDPILITVPQSTRIEVAVQNLSGVNNWEVKTRLKGWIY